MMQPADLAAVFALLTIFATTSEPKRNSWKEQFGSANELWENNLLWSSSQGQKCHNHNVMIVFSKNMFSLQLWQCQLSSFPEEIKFLPAVASAFTWQKHFHYKSADETACFWGFQQASFWAHTCQYQKFRWFPFQKTHHFCEAFKLKRKNKAFLSNCYPIWLNLALVPIPVLSRAWTPTRLRPVYWNWTQSFLLLVPQSIAATSRTTEWNTQWRDNNDENQRAVANCHWQISTLQCCKNLTKTITGHSSVCSEAAKSCYIWFLACNVFGLFLAGLLAPSHIGQVGWFLHDTALIGLLFCTGSVWSNTNKTRIPTGHQLGWSRGCLSYTTMRAQLHKLKSASGCENSK